MPQANTAAKRVDANPEKRFFIDMLIKDIELIPAIVDLVDNSVDAARAARGSRSLNGLSVQIEASPTQFSIVDNCRGIEADVASKYAFRFGRPVAFRTAKGSVGQFGIGMKRSLFKLGNNFLVESIAPKSRFLLEVDVPQWESVEDTDWTFEFQSVERNISNPVSQRGTQITVTALHEGVAEDFGQDQVIKALRREISMKHEPALRDQLEIEVNGRKLEAHEPTLLASSKLVPINEVYTLEVDDEGDVEVQIVAGIAASKERGEKDEDNAAEFSEPAGAGWYVYCNDRMVLAAETGPLTGWGSAAAAYHPQYRRFRGYVFLRADDPTLLPWNTTKTALDQDSTVFRHVQQEMFRILGAVQGSINRAKTERQTFPAEEQPINTAIATASEKPVSSLRESRTFVMPQLPAKRPAPPNTVSVQYRVKRSLMNKVMSVLNADSAGKAGQLTFQYFVDTELRD